MKSEWRTEAGGSVERIFLPPHENVGADDLSRLLENNRDNQQRERDPSSREFEDLGVDWKE